MVQIDHLQVSCGIALERDHGCDCLCSPISDCFIAFKAQGDEASNSQAAFVATFSRQNALAGDRLERSLALLVTEKRDPLAQLLEPDPGEQVEVESQCLDVLGPDEWLNEEGS